MLTLDENAIVGQAIVGQAKVGRPKVNNPKTIKFSIRLDVDTEQKLLKYCKKHEISKGEAIRQGINLLLENKNTPAIEPTKAHASVLHRSNLL